MFKRLRKWFYYKFIMCRCTEPEYEVVNNILKCSVCHKPARWDSSQRD